MAVGPSKPPANGEQFEDQINRLRYAFLLEQVPLLYLVMLTAALIAALAFRDTAPVALVTAVPIGLAVVTGARAITWLKFQERTLTATQVDFQLTVTTFLGPIMAFAFTIWAAALFDYGSEYQQALIGMLVITCMTLTAIILSILPTASSLAVAAACIPFAYKFLSSGSMLLICMLLATIAIAGLLQQVLRRYSSTFEDLIRSRQLMREQHREISVARRQLVKLAYRDELSNLPNQRKFARKVDSLITAKRFRSRPLFVGVIGPNGYKVINSAYGQEIGDLILTKVAKRLSAAMAGHGIAARHDGDQFSFVLTSAGNSDEAVEFAARLCADLERPYQIGQRAALLTASCGISCYPENGGNAETLVNRAIYAQQHVKGQSNKTVSLFTQLHESEIQKHSKIEQALRHAIAKGEFNVVFQPIVDLRTRKIASCEALARWEDDELGVIPPDLFIAIAEKSGVISELTYLLLEDAARAAAAWPSDIMLSFNMSAQEIVNPTAGLRVLAILNDAGLDSRRFEIEITETALLANFEAAQVTIRGLRGAGVNVALDDFGTGQSGLNYVEKIELDKLKIDRAFVWPIETSPKTKHIVKAIADMCNGLQIETVAEGIENENQARLMREMGCTYGQGYLFSRPLSNDALLDLMRSKPTAAQSKAG